MAERDYTSRRLSVVKALAEALKVIDGSEDYLSNIEGRSYSKLKFWDELKEFPSVHVTAGPEYRQYQGGGYKDRFLSITIRVYVNSEDSVEELDRIMEDIETVVEQNSRLEYIDKRGFPQTTHQISVLNITTDEGVLNPLGAGEMLLEVQY